MSKENAFGRYRSYRASVRSVYCRLQVLVARALPAMVAMVTTVPLLVHAQGTSTALLPALPADLTDLGAIAKVAYDAVMNKQWGLLVSVVMAAVVASLRKWVPERTKFGVWLRTKLGAIITNFALSLATAFATMFLAGQPFSADLVFKALSVALAASGGWAVWKNLTEAIQEAKAKDQNPDQKPVLAQESPPKTDTPSSVP